MAKRPFIVILVVIGLVLAFRLTLRYYRPTASAPTPVSAFPKELNEWKATSIPIAADVIDMLKPDAIYNATFTDSQGVAVDLFFSYFSPENANGGVHSPRNCMPGSGWVINSSVERTIVVAGKTIPAVRMQIGNGRVSKVVDFWYVTRHGETANDYRLKWYEMLSSLTLKPTDVSFIRFVANADQSSLAALDRFQQLFTPEVYRILPFGR
jgi:EpsI family protein